MGRGPFNYSVVAILDFVKDAFRRNQLVDEISWPSRKRDSIRSRHNVKNVAGG